MFKKLIVFGILNTIAKGDQIFAEETELESKPSVLSKVELSRVDPLALCNDGTSAVYYVKKSETSKNWLIYLEAGG